MEQLSLDESLSWRSLCYDTFDVDLGFSAFFKRSMLKKNGWIALLFECDFHGEGPKAVGKICLEKNLSQGVAMNIENYEDSFFKLKLEEKNLAQVRNSYHMPSYAIFEENINFIIVSDSDYFWSIAGEKCFLENMFNLPLDSILKDFRAGVSPYLNGTPDQVHIAHNLLQYASICEELMIDNDTTN